MKKLFALLMSVCMIIGMMAGCVKEEPAAGNSTNKFNLKTVKEGYLTVVTSPDYAPYEFYALDENGKPTLAGFDGIIGEMSAGIADWALAGLSPDPERLEKMDFSDIYYGGKQAFITINSKKDMFSDLNSLNNADASIGAQNGTIQMELAAQYSADADIVSLTKATDIIADLVAGNLDGAYVEWDVAVAYQKNYPELHIVCEGPYEADGNVIGVAKGNADLLKYVNEALKQCIESGTFAQYLEKANKLAAGEKYEGMLDNEGNIPTEGE